MKTQNPITPQIEQTITYHTNRLARKFRLQPADKDDIRQELTLKALEASQSHTDDMNANIETYTKQAVRRKAIDLARAIIAFPFLRDIDTECDIAAANANTHLIIDVQSMIERLSDRQKTICHMLMAGYTQNEIAEKLSVTRQRVGQLIQRIRPFFEKHRIVPFSNQAFSV